jgi:antitoxin CcdA
MRMNQQVTRKSTNLSLDAQLVADAKAMGLNLSETAERAIAEAVREEKVRRWKEENREAIEATNRYVAEHGLPLARYRQF